MHDRRQIADRRDGDRRFEPRVPSEGTIRFLRAGDRAGEVLQGELREVSSCGIRLVLDEPISLGERMLVEVRDGNDRCFNLSAAVVWTEDRGDGHWLVGGELSVELSSRAFALLSKLVPGGAAAQDVR